jgi:hypothetical protein
MEAIAALVTRSCDDQHAISGTMSDRIRKDRVGGPGGRELAPTYVDNIRPCLSDLEDGPSQVNLRTREKGTFDKIRENGSDQAPTAGRNSCNATPMLAENHAGNVSAVPRSGSVVGLVGYKRLN